VDSVEKLAVGEHFKMSQNNRQCRQGLEKVQSGRKNFFQALNAEMYDIWTVYEPSQLFCKYGHHHHHHHHHTLLKSHNKRA